MRAVAVVAFFGKVLRGRRRVISTMDEGIFATRQTSRGGGAPPRLHAFAITANQAAATSGTGTYYP